MQTVLIYSGRFPFYKEIYSFIFVKNVEHTQICGAADVMSAAFSVLDYSITVCYVYFMIFIWI